MAHYAFLDENNIVTEVIVGKDENEIIGGLSPELWYENFKQQKCVRTSYNGKIRKNFAGIGFSYDEKLDAFIPPKQFESWLLDLETCTWIAPKTRPNDVKQYIWDEKEQDWVELN